MNNRLDIVELFEKIEAFKAADPRTAGTADQVIAQYVDIENIIRSAGWGSWEYEAALCSVYS